MSDKWITAGVTVMLGIVGVAVLTTLVSYKSDTQNVISAGAGSFACVLRTALTGVDSCGTRGTNVTSTITFPGL